MCPVFVNVRTSLSLASTLGLPDLFRSLLQESTTNRRMLATLIHSRPTTHSTMTKQDRRMFSVTHAFGGRLCVVGGRWGDGQARTNGFRPHTNNASAPCAPRFSAHKHTCHNHHVMPFHSYPIPRHADIPTHPNPTSSRLPPRLFHGQDRLLRTWFALA